MTPAEAGSWRKSLEVSPAPVSAPSAWDWAACPDSPGCSADPGLPCAAGGAVDDQLGHLQQVAQLQQVVGDAEVRVVLLHLLLEQVDATPGRARRLLVPLCPRSPTSSAAARTQLCWITTCSSESSTWLSSQAGRLGATLVGSWPGCRPRLVGADHAFEQGSWKPCDWRPCSPVGHLADGVEAGMSVWLLLSIITPPPQV